MLKSLKRLWNDESGISAVEYGIIAAVIAVALVAAVTTFRDKLTGMFSKASDGLPSS